ncbi:DUF6361 family protein [Nocardioides sp. P86]|uniref:DUF6361 family protein n=1 Tax=Nocardioides sp. P86 TaxID=2939569 RepID=UPI00203AF9CF|nr:DUF6361 family protein [Nocardioides sp. P86]MCM3513835.1 DUF6361 family protein [Nocardioides sp. P86]
MTSLIAWLDSTPEEQRAARELISLFAQQEGRDELGIGQIRDAFSDLLFPGTSVIQTRARYFLFVPWCYSHGKAAQARGRAVVVRGEQQERELIKTLLDSNLEDAVGLIGRRKGPSIKNLPSTIYWSGLRHYNILTHDNDLGLLAGAGIGDGSTELSARIFADWDAGVPAPPVGFPKAVPGGFDLELAEAEWLRDRIVAAAPESVLAHLLDRRLVIPAGTSFAWDVVDREQFEVLDHAYRFSGVMHGASLLYNLLIGEMYDADATLNRIEDAGEYYRGELDAWIEDFVTPNLDNLQHWNIERMWELVLSTNPRIDKRAQLFVEAWVGAIRNGAYSGVANNRDLRRSVRAREERKGKQSRLLNPRMLATWSGASGTGQLAYRWGTVRVIVNDIVKGFGRDARS